MNKKIIIGFFSFAIMFILFAFPVLSAERNSAVLTKILISPMQNNTYAINVYFNNEYRDKAYIQQNNYSNYSIYLPNAYLKNNKAKILYSNNYDKRNIKLHIEQKPMYSQSLESNYIILTTNMNADYSLRVNSKTIGEDKFILFSASAKSMYPLITIGLIITILLILQKAKSITRSRNIFNSNSSFPSTYQPQIYIRRNRKAKLKENALKEYKQQNNNTSNTFKTADRDSFTCFDIPFVEKSEKADFNKIINKSNQTNPIELNNKPKLDIPLVDESKKIKKNPKVDKYGNEILSLLNIDNDKGFYVSASADFMNLYGFNKDSLMLLKKFKDLSQLNLQARFYDNTAEGDVYIVRLDSYKSMVEFSYNSIRELVVL